MCSTGLSQSNWTFRSVWLWRAVGGKLGLQVKQLLASDSHYSILRQTFKMKRKTLLLSLQSRQNCYCMQVKVSSHYLKEGTRQPIAARSLEYERADWLHSRWWAWPLLACLLLLGVFDLIRRCADRTTYDISGEPSAQSTHLLKYLKRQTHTQWKFTDYATRCDFLFTMLHLNSR